MGNKLEGKIAVITGGSSGIGFATAKRFVLAGFVKVTTHMARWQLSSSAFVHLINKESMRIPRHNGDVFIAAIRCKKYLVCK